MAPPPRDTKPEPTTTSGDSPPSTCPPHTPDASADTDSDDEAVLPRVAIVEIGAGGNVTTVRLRSEWLLQRWSRCANCAVVRINPDLPLADKQMNNRK